MSPDTSTRYARLVSLSPLTRTRLTAASVIASRTLILAPQRTGNTHRLRRKLHGLVVYVTGDVSNKVSSSESLPRSTELALRGTETVCPKSRTIVYITDIFGYQLNVSLYTLPSTTLSADP